MEMWNRVELDLGEKKQEGVCREHVRNFNIYIFFQLLNTKTLTQWNISLKSLFVWKSLQSKLNGSFKKKKTFTFVRITQRCYRTNTEY